MGTIRIGARLFKAAVNQVAETAQKVAESVSKVCKELTLPMDKSRGFLGLTRNRANISTS
ncbi:MAG: hypothetical protein HRU09_18775 [Oligoflexales bacterium]|nr:hypothetical protein [Oligoflexales bacterium]